MLRKTPFANNEYYHIYNRGVDKRKIFIDIRDYQRLLLYLELMNDEENGLVIRWREFKRTHCSSTPSNFLRSHLRKKKPLIKTVAYCLNPNHFHLILKQVKKDGISNFMKKIGTGYTMYFNKKYDRSGSLFQGAFKSVHINSNEYLLYISAYVNCNSEVHNIAKAENYTWSSFSEYLGKRKKRFYLCNAEAIKDQFGSGEEYKKYAIINAKAMKKKKEMEKLMLE